MAKQPKDTYKGPEIYRSLNQDNKNMKLCLVFDKNDQIFKFSSKSSVSIVKDAIVRQYEDWDAMECDQQWTLPTLEEEHKKLFKHPIPGKMNRTDATIVVWHKWCEIAQDRTAEGNPVNKTNGRKSSIESRVYTRSFTDGKPNTATLKTPQAMACLKIFDESMDPEKHTITEKDLKAKVIERAAELKTRQDPWRIFQYYRPQLIQAKLITHN